MKKIFALLALTSLLSNFAFAEDFLAKLTKGALSDTSPGVKELSLEEMKEVKGGAISQDGRIIPLLGVLGVSSLSYLNAPTIGGPIYSGQVAPLGRPTRPLWWFKLGL
ncbi:hypothetical protein FHQ59_02895 [Campylobacter jejuni]|uniref:hypothetical protein n=1 Tax=Campylobacter jejuni TaxID=197 RepID=UPI002FBDA48D|nr:hypothetical protein [Campylobacter jejuni]